MIWKKIKEFENYEINERGDIKSLERFKKGKHGKCRVRERIMKPQITHTGIVTVRLVNEKGRKVFRIDKLLLNTFAR